MFLRNVREPWYDLEDGALKLQVRQEYISSTGNPSLVLRRQTHIEGEVVAYLEFEPQSENEMAGIVILQNESHYYFVNKTRQSIQLLKQTESGYATLADKPYDKAGIQIKIEARESKYNFYFSEKGDDYQPLLRDVDATYLSTETAGGFVGCMYGLYATSNGEVSSNHASFGYFEISTQK